MKEILTYLNFDGNCGDAMKFYQQCLGGELSLMPFSEAPGDHPKEAKDRVMHARLSQGAAVLLMASDIMPGMNYRQGNNFSISIQCDSAEEADILFTALSRKGNVTMAMQDTFWGAHFGMLTDQFGINWMLNFQKPEQK